VPRCCNHGSFLPTPKMKKPVPVTGQVLAAAPLYDKDCARCHGGQGAATGPDAKSLPTQPANVTDTKLIKSASDAELFWRITNGRDPMPAFQQLSEKERWELVD